MPSEEKNYEQSALGKRVNELMDDGYDFGEAVKQAMSEGLKDGGSVGIEILFGPKRDNFRYGGDTIGGRNDRSRSSPGPDRSRVSAQQESNHGRAMAAAQSSGGGISYIPPKDKENFLDKIKNTTDKIVDNPLTKFLDPRSKIALAMGGYKFLRDGIPNYQDDAINQELEKIPTMGGISRYADGGRVGLFMGGSPLEGQALAIYNSMNAYGFDDQAIANALTEQGLYTAPGSTPDTPDTTIQPVGLQTGSDNFSPYDPDPNSIKPFKPMGANFQNQKPNAFSTGIAKMMDNPVMKTLGFVMNPPLAFAKGILSKAGSMMPVNERSIFENLAGNQGVRVNDIGQIVNTGKYNTPEGVMAGYNLNQVTDKTFDKRTDRIEKTLSEKYGLTAEEIEDVKAGTYTGKKGFNTTMGTTTNLFSQLRNILSAKNTILGQQNIAAQMAKQQKEAKAAADALAIQQSGLTDLGNIQKIQQYTGQPLSDYRMSRPASERNYTGGSTNSNPSTPGAQDSFSNKSGMGRTGYSDGGLATMFTRRR